MPRRWLNVHKGFLDDKKPCFRVKTEDGTETIHDYLYVYGPAWFEVSETGQAWLVTDGEIETDEARVGTRDAVHDVAKQRKLPARGTKKR